MGCLLLHPSRRLGCDNFKPHSSDDFEVRRKLLVTMHDRSIDKSIAFTWPSTWDSLESRTFWSASQPLAVLFDQAGEILPEELVHSGLLPVPSLEDLAQQGSVPDLSAWDKHRLELAANLIESFRPTRSIHRFNVPLYLAKAPIGFLEKYALVLEKFQAIDDLKWSFRTMVSHLHDQMALIIIAPIYSHSEIDDTLNWLVSECATRDCDAGSTTSSNGRDPLREAMLRIKALNPTPPSGDNPFVEKALVSSGLVAERIYIASMIHRDRDFSQFLDKLLSLAQKIAISQVSPAKTRKVTLILDDVVPEIEFLCDAFRIPSHGYINSLKLSISIA